MKYTLQMSFFGLSILFVACSNDPRQKNFDFFPNMVHPVPVEAFSGKMRKAPEGSIPQGEMPYPYQNNEADASRAAKEFVNPFPTNEKNLQRGQEVYAINCQLCHGIKGQGDGQLIPRFPNPPSFTSKSMQSLTMGRIYHVITYGLGDMASHAQQVSPEDRWMVALYIKNLQGSANSSTPSSETTQTPNASKTIDSSKAKKVK